MSCYVTNTRGFTLPELGQKPVSCSDVRGDSQRPRCFVRSLSKGNPFLALGCGGFVGWVGLGCLGVALRREL